MVARIQPRKLSQDHKLERARAAADRARLKVAQADGDDDSDFAHKPLSWWRARWQDKAIRRLFIENFIYVRDAFDENKLVLLKFNDMQADAYELEARKVVRIKGRRGGSTKLEQAKMFADAVVNSGRRVRAVAHEPDLEEEIRTDFKIMYENLQPHVQPKTRNYSDELIKFHDPLKGTVDSEIRTSNVVAGNERKGRGLGITDLLLTEAAHYRGDQRKAAIALIQAATGGKVTIDTTPYGIELVYKYYQKGKKGKGGWRSQCYEWWWNRNYRVAGARFVKGRGRWLLLLPGETMRDVWRVLPARATQDQRAAARARFDEAAVTIEEILVALKIKAHLISHGYLAKKHKSPKGKWQFDEIAEFIAWRREKVDDIGEADFKVEFLENDIDCFENSGRPVISPKLLKAPCGHHEPQQGHTYIIGVDSSLGRSGGNPSAIAVIDTDLGEMVHSEKERRSPDQLAFRAGELSDHYNGALIVPEANNTGYAVIDALCIHGYGDPERLYRHLDAAAMRRLNAGDTTLDDELEKAPFGFPTTFKGYHAKSTAGQKLEESIRKGWLTVDEAFCEEARVVNWRDNETFGPLPGQDHHADLFMATMIANFVMRIRASIDGGFLGVLPEVGYAR